MKKFLVIVLSIISVNCFSQKLDYGFSIAANTTFHKVTSEYETVDEPAYNLRPGLEIGACSNYKLCNSIGLQNNLKVGLINYREDAIIIRDPYGQELGEWYGNHTYGIMSYEFMPEFKFGKKLSLASGISLEYLYYSNLRINDLIINDIDVSKEVKRFQNRYYRKAFASVPIKLSYSNSFYTIFAQYNYGLSNKLHKEALSKETDDILKIGCSFFINKFYK